MPRRPRLTPPGTLQHVISRFVDREWRFLDEADRLLYLKAVDDLVEITDWQFFAFALMSSHEHWAIQIGQVAFDPFFHRLHTRFSVCWQKRHKGIGPVFAGRPKTFTKAPAEKLRLVSYLHMNPVRAKLHDRPSASRWTSHRIYLRLDPAPKWLNVEKNLSEMGFSDTKVGRKLFDEAVQSIADLESDINPMRTYSDVTEISRPRCEYMMSFSSRKLYSLCDIRKRVEEKMDLPEHCLTIKTRLSKFVSARRIFTMVALKHGYTLCSVADFLKYSPSTIHSLIYRKPPTAEEISIIAQLMCELPTELGQSK